MQISDVFPSKYLKASDLKGTTPTVAIANVAMEELGNERKLVLHFQNKQKGMICNKTNAGRISYLYGGDTDGWVGREIILCAELVEFQGKTVEGLRIRPPVKRDQAPAPAPKQAAPVPTTDGELNDEIPF